MTRASDSADLPLAADDPRISEWLDGRLPPAAAAEVERAVRESPELTRLVEDLREICVALRGLPGAEPPSGFSGRVMAALESRSPAAGGGREGGQSPVGDSPRLRPRIWRAWPALAAALAAGVLVTIVLNLPGPRQGPGDREVALGPALQEAADDSPTDSWTPAKREAEKNAAQVTAASVPAAASAPEASGLAPAPAPGRQAAGEYASREAGGSGSEGRLRKANDEASEPSGAEAEAEKADALAMAAPAEMRGLPQPRSAVAGVLAIEVGSTSSRQALERLVAASGLEVTRAGERLELVGPAAATNAFLGELERTGLLQASPRREAKGLATNSDQPVRLIIRLVVPKRQPTADESRP